MNTEPEKRGFHALGIIRMNSTFLECEDGSFSIKGLWPSFALLMAVLFSTVIGLWIWFVARKLYEAAGNQETELLPFLLVFFLFSLLILILICRRLAKFFFIYVEASSRDYFSYTHYPIRFNRKNKKVYAFRQNGLITVRDWDKLAFLIEEGLSEMEINLLFDDGEFVLNCDMNVAMRTKLHTKWEFICFYMEQPEKLPDLTQHVTSVLDIADRRAYLFEDRQSRRDTLLLLSLLFPFILPTLICRWIAMLTCKIPRWPEEIERECQIEPDDPYLRDRDHLATPGKVPEPVIGA